MGTVKTHGDIARIKARDPNSLKFTDANLLTLINGIRERIYQRLQFISSNLVYTEGSITTVDGTLEYTPSFSHNGFLKDGVWLDGEDWFLVELTEADKVRYDYGSTTAEPEAYYINEDGDVGFLWVPDDAYTVHVLYWEPLTALTDYDTSALGWDNIWNQAIERLLVIEMLEAMERDSSRQAVLAQIDWDTAMNTTYARGVRQYRKKSDMFSVEGI